MQKIKNFFINFWNAEKEVKIRTIAFVIALINLVLYFCGRNQLTVEAEQIWGYITTILTVVTSFRAWWKNNSVTPEARIGDEYMRAARQTVAEEVEEFDENELENEG